ncbi:hypothetical protein RIVM261_074770 [Rivularia sp. IAM M-261]|nr:hypothetical protein RIVM261_074770 [Rivularia sp. IAM M-261]
MDIILLSYEQVAQRAEHLYDTNIRQQVESEDNIGKMVIIDIATGNYEVNKNGLVATDILNEKNPNARLFGIRIGYNVAASLGGVIERISE